MNWKKIRKFLIIAGTIAGLVIFLLMLADSIREFSNARSQFNFIWKWLIVTFLILALVYFSQMVNLWIILNSLTQKIRLRIAIEGFSLALIPKYIPGYIWGYVSRGEWFFQKGQVPVRTSWIASIIETIITIMSGVLIVFANYLLSLEKIFLLLLNLILFPILSFYFTKAIFDLARKIFRNRSEWIIDFKINFKNWVIIILNSVLQWCLLGLALWTIHRSFSMPGFRFSISEYFEYSSTFSLAWLSGFIMIIVPNGLGVREFVLKELLVSNLGMTAIVANLISVLSRILLFVTEGFWFIQALILHSIKRFSQK